MMGNGTSQPQTGSQQEQQRDITTDDVYRQQRGNLALRALDLEAENVMLQQENQKLKARIDELGMPVGKTPRPHPVPSISDA